MRNKNFGKCIALCKFIFREFGNSLLVRKKGYLMNLFCGNIGNFFAVFSEAYFSASVPVLAGLAFASLKPFQLINISASFSTPLFYAFEVDNNFSEISNGDTIC